MEKQQEVHHFAPSSPAMARSYSAPGKWLVGEVTKHVSNMHHDINVDGSVTRCHVDQLRCSSVTHGQGVTANAIHNHKMAMTHMCIDTHGSADDINVTARPLPLTRIRGIIRVRLEL